METASAVIKIDSRGALSIGTYATRWINTPSSPTRIILMIMATRIPAQPAPRKGLNRPSRIRPIKDPIM